MTKQYNITGSSFDGGKFATRYGISLNSFWVTPNASAQNILFYPDSVPDVPTLDAPDPTFSADSVARFGQTTGASTVTGAQFTLPENAGGAVTLILLAKTGTSLCRWRIEATAKRGTGNSSLVGTAVYPVRQGDAALANATAAIVALSGTPNIGAQVTGLAGTTISWMGKLSYEAVVL